MPFSCLTIIGCLCNYLPMEPKTVAQALQESFALSYSPVGFSYVASLPPGAIELHPGKLGCISPLVFAAAKGAIVGLTRETCGWSCSAFYLGFSDSIFPGIEGFLSNDPPPGEECERLVASPELARQWIEAIRPQRRETGVALFQPLAGFGTADPPEVVICFANPDQISALVGLLNFDVPPAPERVVTGYASACASMATIPLRLAREGRQSAVWGCHDVAARAHIPGDLMSLAMPYALAESAVANIGESFLQTRSWEVLRRRCSAA